MPAIRNPLDRARAHEVVWDQVAGLFAAAVLTPSPCFVYLVGEENDGPVKIGVAKDPIGRLRDMQVGNPRRLRVEYVLLGDQAIEKLLHKFWMPFAVSTDETRRNPQRVPRTEWFVDRSRRELLPIIATAVEGQIGYLESLRELDQDPASSELEYIVCGAHQEHDFVFHERDRPLLMTR